MLLAEQVREPEAERGLTRRLQLTEGLLWLRAAQGDPYAALLCGVPGGEPERLRGRGPLWRAATGDWVVTDHATAARALAGDGVEPVTPFGLPADPPGGIDAAAGVPGELPARCDLAAVARRGAARALAGGDAATVELLADAEPALDALLRPQDPERTRRAVAAGAALSGRAARPLLAATGVRLAATLAVNAVAALLAADAWGRLAAEPGLAPRAVAETLRHAPPLRLLPLTVTGAPGWGDGQLAAGDRVVLLLGVANRDPAAFADPDRFDPDRPAGPVLVPGGPLAGAVDFARGYAEALLARLAAAAPRLRADAPPVRPGRAPVTAAAARFDVRAD
ncbi:cytochrome P450 [Micromonospora okii]|uniref:Glycosyl transferase associated protein n=1 Tax=Micromonospora okii TaxID=1182970 RepID=A0A023GUN2_9ACTN|nr:cytochrome P450 [Micromonospora okii]AFJ52683.1 glycosyl transferase associated protein [Micromonospora okii]